MANLENLPFGRGKTFYDGGTIDSANLGGQNLEGREYIVDDINPFTGAMRTDRPVKLRIVRNVGAAALLPKRLASFQATAGRYGNRVDGYADVTAEHSKPIDEYLPAAGVPVNDLCYIVIEGPAVCLTDLAGAGNNVINVGDRLVSLTAASSGATTAGRVRAIDMSGATTPLADNIMNYIGRALTARTTSNTNGDVLVDCGRW